MIKFYVPDGAVARCICKFAPFEGDAVDAEDCGTNGASGGDDWLFCESTAISLGPSPER